MENAQKAISSIYARLLIDYPFLSEWKVGFDNAKRRAGICRISSKEISISRSHIKNNPLEIIEDTILHEFAHAIAYELFAETGHGIKWKQIARDIGATPKAKGQFKVESAPWLLVHSCSETSNIFPIGERFRTNKKIRNYFLIGRPETKGELFFLKQSDYQQYKLGLLDKNRLQLVQ